MKAMFKHLAAVKAAPLAALREQTQKLAEQITMPLSAVGEAAMFDPLAR
jgi:hypothetical protein